MYEQINEYIKYYKHADLLKFLKKNDLSVIDSVDFDNFFKEIVQRVDTYIICGDILHLIAKYKIIGFYELNFIYNHINNQCYKVLRIFHFANPSYIKNMNAFSSIKGIQFMIDNGYKSKLRYGEICWDYISKFNNKTILIQLIDLLFPLHSKVLVISICGSIKYEKYKFYKVLYSKWKQLNFPNNKFLQKKLSGKYKTIGLDLYKSKAFYILKTFNLGEDVQSSLLLKKFCERKNAKGFINFVCKYIKIEGFADELKELSSKYLAYFKGNIKVFKFLKHIGIKFDLAKNWLCRNLDFVKFIIENGYVAREKEIFKICCKGHKNVYDYLITRFEFDIRKYEKQLKNLNRYEFF